MAGSNSGLGCESQKASIIKWHVTVALNLYKLYDEIRIRNSLEENTGNSQSI